MAAPAWKKLTNSDLRHLDAHLDQDERAAHTHSNADIDPERTHENYFIGCSSFKEICEKALKRVAEVDAETPPYEDKKADRIIAVNILIYCPIEIAALDAEIIKLNNECDKLDDYYDLMDKECDKIEEECDRLNAEADAAERRRQTVLKDVALTEIEAQNYELMRERLEEIDPDFLDNLEQKVYETEQKIDAEFPKANDKKGQKNYNER